jgi:hypothetical protein
MPEPSQKVTVEELDRVELAGALAAVEAVKDSAPGAAPAPLVSVAEKFKRALSEDQPEGGEAAEREATLTAIIERLLDHIDDEERVVCQEARAALKSGGGDRV